MEDQPNNKSFLHDERGKQSSGRLAFWIAFPWMLVFVTLHIIGIVTINAVTYGFLTTLFVFLGTWIAGPRVSQHMFPALGSIISGFTSGNSNRSFRSESRQDWGEDT